MLSRIYCSDPNSESITTTMNHIQLCQDVQVNDENHRLAFASALRVLISGMGDDGTRVTQRVDEGRSRNESNWFERDPHESRHCPNDDRSPHAEGKGAKARVKKGPFFCQVIPYTVLTAAVLLSVLPPCRDLKSVKLANKLGSLPNILSLYIIIISVNYIILII